MKKNLTNIRINEVRREQEQEGFLSKLFDLNGLKRKIHNKLITQKEHDDELLKLIKEHGQIQKSCLSNMLTHVIKGSSEFDGLRRDEELLSIHVERIELLNVLICNGNKTLKIINDAINDVESASDMELLDFVTNNKAISIMSTASIGDASDSIKKVEKAIESFDKLVREEHFKLLEINEILRIERTDIFLDLFMNTFDILSVFSFSALSDAETQLKSLKTAIADFVRLNVEERDKISLSFNQALSSLCEKKQPFVDVLMYYIEDMKAPSPTNDVISKMLHSHRLTNNTIGKAS
ncbi:hypothetical protein [Aliivibrio fischeri]|uniref:hypothetical protein n=1 Tax=Aliivibrio fischeri TaxID=668 RepID=UPI0012D90A12|nr:hypothetical protein [Aliivibrio fischeri]MUJ20417.1 hypothetical protein [Aliivibrio fischeri]